MLLDGHSIGLERRGERTVKRESGKDRNCLIEENDGGRL